MLHEIKAEPHYVIYMSACPLLDPFQKYLEISVVFALSKCTATANSTVGNENVLVGDFLRVTGVEYSRIGRCVSIYREVENMFLFPCMKKSLSTRCFLKAGPFFNIL
jgi:hypothetical protein